MSETSSSVSNCVAADPYNPHHASYLGHLFAAKGRADLWPSKPIAFANRCVENEGWNTKISGIKMVLPSCCERVIDEGIS